MSIKTSESIKAIARALLLFQNTVKGVGRDSNNPAFKSKYASLENVVDTIRLGMNQCGLVFMQSGGAIADGVMAMTTRLIHAESGEWIEGNMDIMLGKRDPQGVGSAQTYAQRYHLMAMLGLPPVDDDGEAAIDRNNTRPQHIDARAPAEPVQAVSSPVKSSAQSKRDGDWEALRTEIDACQSLEELNLLVASKQFIDAAAPIPGAWKAQMRDYIQTARDEFISKAGYSFGGK